MQYALVAAALTALPGALAWGIEGHEAVAYVAQSLVTDATKKATQALLSDTSEDWLANVAPWVARLTVPPRYVTTNAMGAGFAELADYLVAARS